MEVAPDSECTKVSRILEALTEEIISLEQLCREGNCRPLRTSCSHAYPSENSLLQAVSQTYPLGFAECMAEYRGVGPQVAHLWGAQAKACRLLSEVGIRTPILYERPPTEHFRTRIYHRKSKKRRKNRFFWVGAAALLVLIGGFIVQRGNRKPGRSE